ncbi:NADH peroxidase [Weissella oryzae SG25]|uniref:NADH peroxidase n=1 Tax=Weissella oryzae (strain DSM 25784 / JCM 18191 / LMG 30913 / SG25) TaxID=1329250 RepID=A0A069CU04_WEIOS|nr:FAD-dependent oxidoreductase [Weissella oryzae]GAK30857.1 NADH peroxidase [Weissella oryzae SG25]
MRIAIIGASHGGHEAALELLTQNKDVEVTIYEASDFISFMSCGMQLYLMNKVEDDTTVRNFKAADLEKLGGKVLANSEVTAIDADQHQLTFTDHDGNKQVDDYDKLILSVGVSPVQLNLPGKQLNNIYLMRGHDWALALKKKLEDPTVKDVVVVGAGYIGIEAIEAFAKAGKHVTVLDLQDRVLASYLDADMTELITKELIANNVTVAVGEQLVEYRSDDGQNVSAVKTDQGSYPADLVIEGVGVKPNTAWLSDVVALDERGWIKTDKYLRTNQADIFAIGDAILPYNIPAKKPLPVALATTARREAQYVAQTIFSNNIRPFRGIVGSSALEIFGYSFATAGLNEATAKRANVAIESITYTDTRQPAFVPAEAGNGDVIIRLAFDPLTHVILGGAVMAKNHDITPHGNTLALAIMQRLTLEDLAEADFFFQPGFDRQWSSLNLAAQKALGYAPFTK